MLASELQRDLAAGVGLRLEAVEIDQGHALLHAQGADGVLFGDSAEPDQDLAQERPRRAGGGALHLQGAVDLFLLDQAALEQDLAELGPRRRGERLAGRAPLQQLAQRVAGVDLPPGVGRVRGVRSSGVANRLQRCKRVGGSGFR